MSQTQNMVAAQLGVIALRREPMEKNYGVCQAKPNLANQSSLLPFDPQILLPRFF